MKNACIVGYGAIGPVHAEAISHTPYAQLYAVCDINITRAQKCSQKYGCKIYTEFKEVLSDKNIDTVHICTPHHLHKDMMIDALEAGKYVVLEKPVAINIEELNELVEYVVKNNVADKVCVMLQNRTNNSIRKLKEIVENDSSIGALKGISATLTWHRDEAYYNQGLWRGKWSTEGGGLMINQAVHLLDLMFYFGGSVKSIKTDIRNWKITNIEVEDTASALLEFESGAIGVFNATNCYTIDESFFLDLRFENRHLRYADNFLYDITSDGCTVLAKDDSVKIGKSYWGNGHNNVIDGFYGVINKEKGEYTNIIDAVDTMKLLFDFYNSDC